MLTQAHLIIIVQIHINNSSYYFCHISSNNKSCLVYNCLQPFLPIFLERDIMSAFLHLRYLIHWLLKLESLVKAILHLDICLTNGFFFMIRSLDLSSCWRFLDFLLTYVTCRYCFHECVH